MLIEEKINIDKLKELRDFLVSNKEVISPRFEMGAIIKLDGENKNKIDFDDPTSSGCVIGWSTAVPGFYDGDNLENLSLITAFNNVIIKNGEEINFSWEEKCEIQNILDYINSHYWGDIDRGNTLDAAIERIDKILSGYDVGVISNEIYKFGWLNGQEENLKGDDE